MTLPVGDQLYIFCIVSLMTACGGGGSSAVEDPGDAADGNLANILETARSGHNVPALAAVLIERGIIIVLHVAGVLYSSYVEKENLPKAMITGRKRVD